MQKRKIIEKVIERDKTTTYVVNRFLGETIEYVLIQNKGKKKLLIISPMKGGKTTSIKKIKDFYAKQYKKIKMVVISPKKTLLEMVANDLGYEKVYGEYPYNNYKVSEKDVVTTPDSSYKVFNELNKNNIPYIVVYDEIHAMYLHSSFRNGLVTPKAYINSNCMIKYIGLTATGEFIPPTEFDDIALIRPKEQWKFTEEIDVVDYKDNNLINNVLKELQVGIKDYKQVILRHNDKKTLEEIKKGLNALDISCILFSSDEFKNNEELSDYIKRQTIEHKIILTTSSTDEGVELLTHSDNVLLLATYNEHSNIIDIIQQFGRYRKGTKKCKILCFNFAEGCKFEERKTDLEVLSKMYLKFSMQGSKAYDTKFIRKKENGFEIKEEIILEECIKADLQYKVNTIDKLISFLKEYYLTRDIKIKRAKGKKKALSKELAHITESLKESKIKEKEIKETENLKLNYYMTNVFPNLHSSHQKTFLTRQSEIVLNDKRKLEELEPFYSMFWNDNNKEKRKHYRELLKEQKINELTYIQEIVKLLYDEEEYKKYLKFKELEKVRTLKVSQVAEISEKIQHFKRDLTKKQRIGFIIRYALQGKEIQQGRITKRNVEEIKILLEENKLLTKRQLERKKELDKYLNSLIENIYSFKNNGTQISCIRKSIFTF